MDHFLTEREIIGNIAYMDSAGLSPQEIVDFFDKHGVCHEATGLPVTLSDVWDALPS